MSLHLKLLDIDHPLSFDESKFRHIEAHALIYLRRLFLFASSRVIKFLFLMPQSRSRYLNRKRLENPPTNISAAVRFMIGTCHECKV